MSLNLAMVFKMDIVTNIKPKETPRQSRGLRKLSDQPRIPSLLHQAVFLLWSQLPLQQTEPSREHKSSSLRGVSEFTFLGSDTNFSLKWNLCITVVARFCGEILVMSTANTHYTSLVNFINNNALVILLVYRLLVVVCFLQTQTAHLQKFG